jgi:hypothetical protein
LRSLAGGLLIFANIQIYAKSATREHHLLRIINESPTLIRRLIPTKKPDKSLSTSSFNLERKQVKKSGVYAFSARFLVYGIGTCGIWERHMPHLTLLLVASDGLTVYV